MRLTLALLAIASISVFIWGCGGGGSSGGTAVSKYLFVGNTEDDTISRYTIDSSTGELSFLGTTGLAYLNGPTGLVMHPNGDYLYASNSSSHKNTVWNGNGTVSVFQYDSATGDLIETPNSPFPASSMALQIAITPSGDFIYTTDQDNYNITIFEVDGTTGDLTEAASSPMAESEAHGIVMHPSGDFVYMANEEDDEIAGYSINAVTGSLTPVPNSPYPVGNTQVWASITPDGKYIYSSDASGSAIDAFSIDNMSGELTSIAGFPINAPGTGLKSSVITNNGKYIYFTQWTDDSVMGYAIDDADGTLTAIPNMPAASGTTGSSPKALTVDSHDQFLYVANYNGDSVDLFNIDSATGELNYVDTYPAGNGPKALITVP